MFHPSSSISCKQD